MLPTPSLLLKGLVLAVTFLSRIHLPFKWCDMRAIAVAPAWFPLMGWVIGAIAMIPAVFVFWRWGFNPNEITLIWSAPVLFVAMLAWLTRGFHFDGWCDCCDALMAVAAPERRREILKDSRVGSGAVLGGTLLIVGKVVFLLALTISHFYGGIDVLLMLGIYLAPVVLSRLMSCVLSCVGTPFGGEGLTGQFVGQVPFWALLIAWLTTLPLLYLIPLGLYMTLCAVGGAVAFWWYWKGMHAFDGLNGDVLGAVVESSEAFMYLALLFLP